jgi:FMN-dependent NADH-azoreductase
MKKVLVINCSLNNEQGNSNKLTEMFVRRWQQAQDLTLSECNLSALNLPHLSRAEMQAWGTSAAQRSAEQAALAEHSDKLVGELKAADSLVLGMPMYNFGVPSTFKAWIDRVARAGLTFNYTAEGPKGLLEGKTLYILAARGGVYAGTPADSQSQYLKDVFAFLGITDIHFIYAEGLAMGDESSDKAWRTAQLQMEEVLPAVAA